MARLRFWLRVALLILLIPFAVAAVLDFDWIDQFGWWNAVLIVPFSLSLLILNGISNVETVSSIEDQIERVARERTASFFGSAASLIPLVLSRD